MAPRRQWSKLMNQSVIIDFWDHAEDSKDLVLCRIWGEVSGMDKNRLTITCWDLPEAKDEVRGLNVKVFAIIKKSIVKLMRVVRLESV